MKPVIDINENIQTFMFDKKGRLNYRRFDKFKTLYPDEYNEILNYSKDFELRDSSFRYQFLVWFYKYKKDDLICRRDGCNNPVDFCHHKPNKLCSKKCRTLDGENIGKILKKSNIEKYGVVSTAQLKQTQLNFKKTMLNKYGYEYAMQVPSLITKYKKTMVKNYGVEWPSQSKDIVYRKKIKSLLKYGVPHPSARLTSVKKIIETKRKIFYKKYGNKKIGYPHYNISFLNKLTPSFIQNNYLTEYGFINLDQFKSDLNCSRTTVINIFKHFKIKYKKKQTGFDKNKPASLYYIKDLKTGLYKIGVTHNILTRFSAGLKNNRIELLNITTYSDGSLAYRDEQDILNTYTSDRIINLDWPEKWGGKTEFFNKDILHKDCYDNRA